MSLTFDDFIERLSEAETKSEKQDWMLGDVKVQAVVCDPNRKGDIIYTPFDVKGVTIFEGQLYIAVAPVIGGWEPLKTKIKEAIYKAISH